MINFPLTQLLDKFASPQPIWENEIEDLGGTLISNVTHIPISSDALSITSKAIMDFNQCNSQPPPTSPADAEGTSRQLTSLEVLGPCR
jgi:hypothetical protein